MKQLYSIKAAMNEFYDIKQHSYYEEVINNNVVPYKTKFKELQSMLVNTPTKVVSVEEYCTVLLQAYNGILGLRELLILEPQIPSFVTLPYIEMFFQEKLEVVNKIKKLLIQLN